MNYSYLLIFHIVSMVSWMAMLFYLPRLFVYHQENKCNKQFIDIIMVQEYKLYKYIGLPAMWSTIISGSLLVYENIEIFKTGLWIYAKLLVVFFLILYSFSLEHYRKQLSYNQCNKSSKFFRAYNEIPTLFLILIVTYVILKTVSIYFTVGVILLFTFIMYMILRTSKKQLS